MDTKTITFLGNLYIVPTWVSWVGRNDDGTIIGYQYEPFEQRHGERLIAYGTPYGRECVIYSPKCEPVLHRLMG